MTIQEVIAQVDDLMPNQYTTEQKIRWLSTLDGKIWHEVIMTHKGPAFAYYPFDGYDSDDAELLVPAPFAEDVYGFYVKSRIAAENNEIAKYEQNSTLFNEAYKEFTAWWTRTHTPIAGGRWRM